jgi:hypothetical protein
MKKEILEKFIATYHLGGEVDSVVWTVSNNETTVYFNSPDKTAVGTVVSKELGLSDMEIGINSTAGLLKLLSPFDKELEVSYLPYKGNKNGSLNFKNSGTFKINAEYKTSETEVIPKPTKLKATPEYQIALELNDEIISKVVSIKNSLPDSKTFTFTTEEDSLRLIVGYASDINIDNISLLLPAKFEEGTKLDYYSYSANMLKNILSVNKGFKTGKLEISDKGLIHVEFTYENMKSDYYLVKLKSV